MLAPFPQVAAGPDGVALQTAPPLGWQDSEAAGPLIETEYSIVSAGTELAIIRSRANPDAAPYVLGYGSVGRIVQGSGTGQRVFTYGCHGKYSPVRTLTVPVPEGVDPARATFARLAAVSITALRVADTALGDTVAVFGLGLVGNLAAQFFALAGCEVIGIDLSAQRRAQAAACGVPHVLGPGDDLKEQVAALTGGRMCRAVVEATGVPAVAAQAGGLAGKGGELILLGSPRGQFEADLVPFLKQVHLWEQGCVTVKGAHEWRYPVHEDPEGHGRFSMEGNVRAILRLIASDRLKTGPLLTHVVSPAACAEVYAGLRDQPDVYVGVVYDWTKG